MKESDSDEEEYVGRGYQIELAEQSIKANKILFLPTGSGKTFIAIMVLKKLLHELEGPFDAGGKRAFFLVNTVALVDQQADVLVRHLHMEEVGRYSGDKMVDSWSIKIWKQELCKFQVMVMTAEIFHQIVLKKCIQLEQVALVIMDECHHAVEDHPMRQIMRLFEDCEKDKQPRVVGLTACLLNGNPKSLAKVEDLVRELEITVHSTVATVDSWEIVKKFSTKPNESFVTFETDKINIPSIQSYVRQLCSTAQLIKLDSEKYISSDLSRKGFSHILSAKKNEIRNFTGQIMKQLGFLGPYGCNKTAMALISSFAVFKSKAEDKETKIMLTSLICCLAAISKILMKSMSKYMTEELRAWFGSSDKVHQLLYLLKRHYDDWGEKSGNGGKKESMQALIFVQERMTCKVLCSVLKNISRTQEYSFLKADFVVGGSLNPLSETWEASLIKMRNDDVLKKFRDKKINILVATNVLEEGIDIPLCSLVVKFDRVHDFRSYIQSKGRARHQTSKFILMSNTEEVSEYRNKVCFFRDIEIELTEILVGKTDLRESPTEEEISELYSTELEPYLTPSGSRVTQTSAIQLVNGYCLSLCRDRFTRFTPIWGKAKLGDGKRKVCIQMPTISPFKDIIEGAPFKSLKLAKRAAALKMCEMLHKNGFLNDSLEPKKDNLNTEEEAHLFPLWDKDDIKDPKPGTKARTRKYKTKEAACFQSCYPNADETVFIHVIKMQPTNIKMIDSDTLPIFEALRKGEFAILSSKCMPQICDFPVYFSFGEIKVTIAPNARTIHLSCESLLKLKKFHFHLFYKMVPVLRDYCQFEEASYLVAPIMSGEYIELNWRVIDMSIREVPPEKLESPVSPGPGCVVIPTYRPQRSTQVFFVTGLCHNALSPFPNQKYVSYKDYFSKQYHFDIKQPSLPLLAVKAVELRTNALKPRGQMVHTNDFHVVESNIIHLPAEGCLRKPQPGGLWLKATLLPSVLYRLERLLIADDLRTLIAAETRIGVTQLPDDAKWQALKGEVYKAEKKNYLEDTKLTMNSPSYKKSYPAPLEQGISKPWGDAVLPPDLDRNFENSTMEDVTAYVVFSSKKIEVSQSPYRVINQHLKQKQWTLPSVVPGEGCIKLLSANSRLGPEPSHILSALTGVACDDVVNLERLETLGDAFLKLSVSFFLYLRFPKMAEGPLTELKGRIVGNRNLLYCGRQKDLGCYLKDTKVEPTSLWKPPCFTIPGKDSLLCSEHQVISMLDHLKLSEEEQFLGHIEPSTFKNVQELLNNSFVPVVRSSSNMSKAYYECYLGEQTICDKNAADVVEALIGAYLEQCGPNCALGILEWLQILPGSSTLTIENLTTNLELRNLFHCPNMQPVRVYFEGSEDLEERLGYKFKNRAYLREAMTHCSQPSNTASYERLEFIGDAVLDFLVTAYIYESFPKLDPGQLTDLRSALVNNITFACLAIRYGFQKFMLHASPMLLQSMDRFIKFQEDRKHVVDDEVLMLLEERECQIAETVDVPKALGDIFETLAGAVFLDSGRNLKETWRVFYRLMKNEIGAFGKNVPKQVVRRLHEAAQHLHASICFRVAAPEKASLIEEVMVVLTVEFKNGEVKRYNGFGVNKQQARKSAAKLALKDFKDSQ